MSNLSLQELRSECETIYSFANTLNNCGYLNSCVSEFLTSHDIDHEFITGGRGSIVHESSSAPHQFIVIEEGELEDISTELIVDVTIDQFCTENSDEVSLVLGNHTDIPSVALVGPDQFYGDTSVPLTFDMWKF